MRNTLIPTFQPPVPAKIFRQSAFDRIALLFSLDDNSSNRLELQRNMRKDILNKTIAAVNKFDESNTAAANSDLLLDDLNLFGGNVKVSKTILPPNENSLYAVGKYDEGFQGKLERVTKSISSQKPVTGEFLSGMLKTINENSKLSLNSNLKRSHTSNHAEISNSSQKRAREELNRDTTSIVSGSKSADSIKLGLSSKNEIFRNSLVENDSSDFRGIGSFCRNAGSSEQSLSSLLDKCQSAKVMVLTIIWKDLSSNHVPITSKYCTPSSICNIWYCTCDKNIRIQQAHEPALGLLLLITEIITDGIDDVNILYYLPLAPCRNHDSDTMWQPNYSSQERKQKQQYRIPLQSSTTLEQRWLTLQSILCLPVKKIIHHSHLFLLPVMNTLTQLPTRTDLASTNIQIECPSLFNNLFDTRIAAHLCDSDLTDQQLELQALLTRFTIPPSHNHRSNEPSSLSSQFGKITRAFYHLFDEMKDVYRLYLRMQERLIETQSLNVFESVEMPLVPILTRMELIGICISTLKMEELNKIISIQIQHINHAAHSLAHEVFNLGSPDQVAMTLYDKLKLPPPIQNKPGGKSGSSTGNKRHASTSEEDLLPLRDKHPVVQYILDYRMLSKIKSTYIEGMEPFVYSSPVIQLPTNTGAVDDTSSVQPLTGLSRRITTASLGEKFETRIHAYWNQTGVRTGRLSCSKPNLQNIPKHPPSYTPSTTSLSPHHESVTDENAIVLNTRDFFHASPNHVFVGADYSQIEMRILAHISNDAAMRSLFMKEGDIYRHLAGIIFNKLPDDVDKSEREKAKVVALGVIYGMGPQAAATRLNIEVSAAVKITNTFFDKFKTIRGWLNHVRVAARQNGFVTTVLGRRRYLPEITSTISNLKAQAERQAVNTIIQGTASEVIKVAMLEIDRELSNWSYELSSTDSRYNPNMKPRLILQIHDELIFEVNTAYSENYIHDFVTLLRRCMGGCVMDKLQMSVPLLVSVQTGVHWGDMQPYSQTSR